MKRLVIILLCLLGATVFNYGHTPYSGSPTGSSWGYKSSPCSPSVDVGLKNQIVLIYQATSDWYATFRVIKQDYSSFSSPGIAELWDETTGQKINNMGYSAGIGSIDIGGNISYIQSGTHQFVVKIIPSTGCTEPALWSDKYYISNINAAPSQPSPLQEPRSGQVGQVLTYQYQVSDPDGDQVNLHVNWGDGTDTWESGLVNSGSMLYPSHSYNTGGTFSIYVRAFDEHGKEGTLREFQINITYPLPTVTVLAPNGGESWEMGTNHDIRWTASAGTNATIDHIWIELYRNDTLIRYIAGSDSELPGSQRIYNWPVPDDLEAGNDYKIKVIAWDNYGQPGGDESDGTFAITGGIPNNDNKISGRIFETHTTGLLGVSLRIEGGDENIDVTIANNQDGTYTFELENGLAPGTYTITPSKSGYTFYPADRKIKIGSEDVTGVNFYIDNEVPVVNIHSPASGSAVFGAILFQGIAYTEVTTGTHAGFQGIAIFVNGEEKAWAYHPESDYSFPLEELTWHNGHGTILKNWDEILPSSSMATIQIRGVGNGDKIGYSPHIPLILGGGINVSIDNPALEDMPLLNGSEETANVTITGGSGTYTYDWQLNNNNSCAGCTDTFTFNVNLFSYYLNLTVEDTEGNTGTARLALFVDNPSVPGNPESLGQAIAGYGVNVVTGNFFMQRTDLALPAVGLPIIFTRTYNSSRFFNSHDVSLGKGWNHSYNIKLKAYQYSPKVDITWGDGMEETWMWVNGLYRSSSRGNFGILEKDGDNFVMTDKNRVKYNFAPEAQDSESYRLDSIVDHQGNTISLTYNAQGELAEVRNNTSNRYIILAYTNGKLTSLIDNAGRSATFSYTSYGGIDLLSGATDIRGKTERYQYVQKTDLGVITDIYMLSTIIDKKGNTILTNVYDLISSSHVQARYRCTSQTDAGSNTYSINYVNETETIVINPLNQSTKFVVDSAGRVTDIIDPKTYKSTFVFGNDNSEYKPYRGLPSKIVAPQQNGVTNPAGTVLGYSTDGQGNLTDLWTPNPTRDGSTTGYHYQIEYFTDAAVNKNLIKSSTDPLNNRIDYSYYDGSDLLKTVTFPDPTENSSVTYTYDDDGQVLTTQTIRDGITQIFRYEYANSYKDLTKTTTPLDSQINIQYDAAGRIEMVTDPMGKITSYTYDGDLIKTRTIPIDGSRTASFSFTYDNNGRLTDIKDALDKHTYFEYNTLGLLVKEANAAGNIVHYEYDKLNRLKRKTYTVSKLYPLEYDYDSAGNLSDIRNVSLNELLVTYTYDGNGNILTETDGLNRKKTFNYDNMDRLTRITYDDGTYESFIYNDISKIEHFRDRRGNTSDYEYDSLGRLKIVIEPVATGQSVSTEIHYDTVGNIKEIITPGTKVIRFQYDNDNRLTKRIEDANGAALQFSYSYYNNNHLQKYTADGLTATYNYYDCGWPKSVAYSGGTTIAFTYNDNGYLTGMSDGSGSTSYSRDEVGRMLSRTDPFGNMVGYHYDSIGRMDKLTYPGSKQVTYSYDAAHRLKTVASWLGVMANYNYNSAGQLSSLGYGNGTSAAFGYQPTTGRLNFISHKKSDNTVIASYQFNIDGNGNRTLSSEVQPLFPKIEPQNISFVYDGANRLQSAGDKTFNYNDRGVLTAITTPEGNYSFNFDILDRLTSLSGPNLSVSFVYDGQGNRLSQNLNGEVTRYVVDANKKPPDVLMEVDGSNNPKSYYVYGLGLIARTDETGNNPRYYHFDGTGSTMALTDSSQLVTDAYAYDPYGNVNEQFGTTSNPFKYVGQFGVQEAPAGLQYMRARYYMPEIGGFLSRDKIWGTATKSQSLNLFAYAQNNPINLIDNDGNYPEPYWKKAFGIEQYLENRNKFYNGEVREYPNYTPPPCIPGQDWGYLGQFSALFHVTSTIISNPEGPFDCEYYNANLTLEKVNEIHLGISRVTFQVGSTLLSGLAGVIGSSSIDKAIFNTLPNLIKMQKGTLSANESFKEAVRGSVELVASSYFGDLFKPIYRLQGVDEYLKIILKISETKIADDVGNNFKKLFDSVETFSKKMLIRMWRDHNKQTGKVMRFEAYMNYLRGKRR